MCREGRGRCRDKRPRLSSLRQTDGLWVICSAATFIMRSFIVLEPGATSPAEVRRAPRSPQQLYAPCDRPAGIEMSPDVWRHKCTGHPQPMFWLGTAAPPRSHAGGPHSKYRNKLRGALCRYQAPISPFLSHTSLMKHGRSSTDRSAALPIALWCSCWRLPFVPPTSERWRTCCRACLRRLEALACCR